MKSELIHFEKDLQSKLKIEDFENKILCGDTLNILKKMPSKSVSLIITSPSYFLGKKYETNQNFEEYLSDHKEIINESKRVLKDNGAIFWNVAQSVIDKEIIHLGSLFYNMFKELDFYLKNWIIWKFEGGETPRNRLFGRYENILWMVKNKEDFIFNVDDIRVPTKWLKDKRVRKDGKNPEDFWTFDNRTNQEKIEKLSIMLKKYKKLLEENAEDYVNQILMDELFRDMENTLNDVLSTKDKIVQKNIEDNIWHINRVVNVSKKQKIKHPETNEAHPCPFPEDLIERIIKMSSNRGDVVLDIFCGSGTVFKIADKNGRKWSGIDKEIEYCEISEHRYNLYKKEK